MTKGEMKLAAYFLDMAADEFSNHGCNDMPKEALEASGFDFLEATEFARQCCDQCYGMTDEEIKRATFMRTTDYSAMHMLALKLRAEASRG